MMPTHNIDARDTITDDLLNTIAIGATVDDTAENRTNAASVCVRDLAKQAPLAPTARGWGAAHALGRWLRGHICDGVGLLPRDGGAGPAGRLGIAA